MKVEHASIAYPVGTPLLAIPPTGETVYVYRVPIVFSGCSCPPKQKDLVGGNITVLVQAVNSAGVTVKETFSLGLSGVGVTLGATGNYLIAPSSAIPVLAILGIVTVDPNSGQPSLTVAGQASKITLYFC